MKNVIVTLDGLTLKQLDMSLYEFINKYFYKGEKSFAVCHISEKKYKKIEDKIKKGDSLKIYANLGEEDANVFMVFDNKVSDNIFITDNRFLFWDESITYNYIISSDNLLISNKYELPFPTDEIASSFNGIKVYTTQTYKDVIKHYSKKLKREVLTSKRWYTEYKKILLKSTYNSILSEIQESKCKPFSKGLHK